MSFNSYNSDETNYYQTKDTTQTRDGENPKITEVNELTIQEKENLCKAFSLLDVDGDGVIETPHLQNLIVSWGRMPMNEDLDEIMSYAKGQGCEGETGMDFENFQKYIGKQLANTSDEEELRNALRAFDSSPPTGKINLTELRHYLKYTGMKLTDDEIDFLYKEEDYWMLEEKNIFDYEQLINKILDKPNCRDPFLNCWKENNI